MVRIGLVITALLCAAPAFAGGKAAAPDPKSIPSKEKHPVDSSIPAAKGELIDLKVGTSTAKAYVKRPPGAPAGAVLVLHEWWGLNDGVKHESDRLSELGYLVLALDLYKGQVGKTPEEAGALMKGMDQAWADQVEAAGVAWLKKELPDKKLATIGWCFGGRQSLLSSLNNAKSVDGTIIYYGMPDLDVARLKALHGPVLGFWAKKDGWITPEVVGKFEAALKEAGVKYSGTSYDADHAFANPTGGKHNPEAAKDAWGKTITFLRDTLK